MKLLENKTNVTAPDADYPFGSVRDKTPSLAGTIWNFEMMSDIIQFFSKMFNQSGLTANGLPDNDTNGFQLFEALLALNGGMLRKVVEIGTWDMDATVNVTIAHGVASGASKIRKVTVLIYSDASTMYDINFGGAIQADATNVIVGRDSAGAFDDPGFSSTGINRGFIIIDYIL